VLCGARRTALPVLSSARLSASAFDVRGRGGLRGGVGTGLPVADLADQEVDKCGRFIEAGNLLKILATGFEKALAALHGDFLQRLQTVGGKSRANDFDPFMALLCQLFERFIGVGLQPGIAPEPTLEGEHVFVFRQTGGGHKFLDRHGALVAVAGAVCRMAGVAAIGRGQAVVVRGVPLDQMALGDAVKRKDQLIKISIGE